MTRMVLDPVLGAKLGGLTDAVELCDESGRTIGYFHPAVALSGLEASSIESPIPIEEIERRRAEGGGRPLKDILEDLSRR